MSHKDVATPAWLRALEVCGARGNAELLKKGLTAEESGLGLLMNVGSKQDIKRAHQLGYKCATYIALMDTFIAQTGDVPKAGTYGRVAWDKHRAGTLLLDRRGRPVNTFMDGSKRMARFVGCANSPEYRDFALWMVRQVMERGSDGLFIDNAGLRIECHGEGCLIGYSKKHKTVIVARPGVVQYDPEVANLAVHRHVYPELDHNSAYERLLGEITETVRSYGKDNVVIKNGEDLGASVDAVMIESYICSWAWDNRYMTRAMMLSEAAEYEDYLARGHQVVALSFLGHTPNEVKDDAYYCYACARACGFAWTDYQTMGESEAGKLYRVRLGRPVSDLLNVSGVDYRVFEKGVIAINFGSRPRKGSLRLPGGELDGACEDLYSGQTLTAGRGVLRVEVPADSGRVYVAE